MRSLLILVLVFCSNSASAGYTELGLSGNYRQSYIRDNYYSIVQSMTGSLAYYFWEMSALELSYTSGRSSNVTPDYTATAEFELLGLDFVLSFGKKEAAFKPYIKVGGAYQKKKLTYMQRVPPPDIQQIEGPSPSAGAGFRLMLGESFGIKAGIEAWTSPLTGDSRDQTSYDIAGRAGISWMF